MIRALGHANQQLRESLMLRAEKIRYLQNDKAFFQKKAKVVDSDLLFRLALNYEA